MDTYKIIIEIILLFLTIYLTQNITALNPSQIQCLIQMDNYCSTDEPPEGLNETDVNNGENVTDELMTRWKDLTPKDCAKAEFLKWTRDDTLKGYVAPYRIEILDHIAYNKFLNITQFCIIHNKEDIGRVFNCKQALKKEFGDEFTEIRNTALKKKTLANYAPDSIEAKYLKEIAGAAYIPPMYRMLTPYEHCIKNAVYNLDNPTSSHVDSSDDSTSTSGDDGSVSNN